MPCCGSCMRQLRQIGLPNQLRMIDFRWMNGPIPIPMALPCPIASLAIATLGSRKPQPLLIFSSDLQQACKLRHNASLRLFTVSASLLSRIARVVGPAILPSLSSQAAIKQRLPLPVVHIVVCFTHPSCQCCVGGGIGRV